MKRMLLTAVSVVAASAAFAAPASAQDLDVIDFNVGACAYGETYTECAFRIARDADDIAIDTAQYYVNYAGQVVGDGLETAKYLCGQVIRACGTL